MSFLCLQKTNFRNLPNFQVFYMKAMFEQSL